MFINSYMFKCVCVCVLFCFFHWLTYLHVIHVVTMLCLECQFVACTSRPDQFCKIHVCKNGCVVFKLTSINYPAYAAGLCVCLHPLVCICD